MVGLMVALLYVKIHRIHHPGSMNRFHNNPARTNLSTDTAVSNIFNHISANQDQHVDENSQRIMIHLSV